MHALFITFQSAVALEALEPAFTQVAEALRDGDVRGFVAKTWMYDGSTAGGYCVFEDREAADGYLAGMFAEAVAANPIFSDIRIERYEVNETLSRITNGVGALAASSPS